MTTTDTPSPIALDIGRDTLVHFSDTLATATFTVEPSFWDHTGAAQPELAEGRVLCVADYTETWTGVEVHPVGDELVMLLSGDVDLVLERDSECHTLPLRPGQAAIVPAGTWHRVVVRGPSRMLFVTPTPAGTQVRPVA
jgi:mannose-6-phosphate isomerase-like protein (cupin superfamily)